MIAPDEAVLKILGGDQRQAYRKFESTIVQLVQDFWRSNDIADLDAAVQQFVTEGLLAAPQHDGHLAATSFRGWVAKRPGLIVSLRALRSLNPDYRILLNRHSRPDVDLVLGGRGRATGFIVHAIGIVSAPPFIFGVSDLRRRLSGLEASTPLVAADLAGFWPRNGQKLTGPYRPCDRAPMGYIDALSRAPLATSDKGTWIAELVARHPAEMFEIVQHSNDDAFAAATATHTNGLLSGSEWDDRFAMLVKGTPPTPVSNLVPHSVWRPTEQNKIGVDTTPAPRPHGEHRDGVWSFHDGPELLPVPSQEWLEIDNATIQNGGTVLAGGGLIVYEAAADPTLDFVSGNAGSIYGSRIRRDRALVRVFDTAEETIREGILLSGRNDDNWYHWMIEYLPRVLQIDASIDADVPLLVSTRTPPTGLEALRTLTDRPISMVDAATAQRVERLHVLAPPVQILDTTRIPWSEGLSLNAAPLLEMRRRWGFGEHSLNGRGRQIFLHRASARRSIVNQAELAQRASDMGLELVDPSLLSWRDQAELFSSSSLLVGASGAVMANYLAMQPGSRILALTSEALSDFILPAAIAGLCGVTFTYLTGPNTSQLSDHPQRNYWLHSGYRIDVDSFESAVRKQREIMGR